MEKFKVGDRVVCVDDSGPFDISTGQEYELVECPLTHLGYVRINGHDEDLLASRFRLSPQISVDCCVKCVNATCSDLSVGSESSAKYEAELARCAAIVQKVYVGGVSGIGLLNVADALQEIFAEQDATLSEPLTVEWLCEIGGEQFASGIVFFKSPHGVEFDYWGYQKKWTIDGSTVKTPIITRGDVLAWLNVLGIVPKSRLCYDCDHQTPNQIDAASDLEN